MSAHRQNWVAAVAKVAKPLVKYIALEYGKAWLDRFRASDRPTQKRMLLSVSDKMGKLALVGGPVNWVLVRASKRMRESDAVLNAVADILSNKQATDKIVGSAKQMTASSSTSAAANPRRRNNALGRSYSKTRKRTGKWGDPTKIQSLLFGKGWSPSAAQDWAMEHGFNAHAIDQPAEYIRIRQAAPAAFNKSTLRTITLTDKYGSPIKAITGVRLPVDYKKKQEAKMAKAYNRNPRRRNATKSAVDWIREAHRLGATGDKKDRARAIKILKVVHNKYPNWASDEYWRAHKQAHKPEWYALDPTVQGKRNGRRRNSDDAWLDDLLSYKPTKAEKASSKASSKASYWSLVANTAARNSSAWQYGSRTASIQVSTASLGSAFRVPENAPVTLLLKLKSGAGGRSYTAVGYVDTSGKTHWVKRGNWDQGRNAQKALLDWINRKVEKYGGRKAYHRNPGRNTKAAYCRVCQGPHRPHKKARR